MKVGRKPLNNLQNPQYSTYKKEGPRFVNSGKHWMVDPGKVMYESSEGPLSNGMIDSVVLIQNRDYSKQFAYGISSHKSTVNEDFRPPMQDEYLDKQSLSRIPVKINPVRGRINKGTDTFVNADNSRTGYQPYIDKSYNVGVKHAEWRQNLGIPFDDKLLREGNVLPDLVKKLPSYAASAGSDVTKYGMVSHEKQYANDGEYILEKNLPEYAVSAGFDSQFTVNGEHQKARLVLEQKRGTTSASAGFNPNLTISAPDALQNIELGRNMPEYSTSAGINPGFTQDGEVNTNYDFKEKPKAAQGVINVQSDYYIDNLDKNTNNMKFKEETKVPKENYRETPLKMYDFRDNVPQIRLRNDAHSASKPAYASQGFIPKTGITFTHHRLRDVKVGKQM
jgi:hypothetical protein